MKETNQYQKFDHENLSKILHAVSFLQMPQFPSSLQYYLNKQFYYEPYQSLVLCIIIFVLINNLYIQVCNLYIICKTEKKKQSKRLNGAIKNTDCEIDR